MCEHLFSCTNSLFKIQINLNIKLQRRTNTNFDLSSDETIAGIIFSVERRETQKKFSHIYFIYYCYLSSNKAVRILNHSFKKQQKERKPKKNFPFIYFVFYFFKAMRMYCNFNHFLIYIFMPGGLGLDTTFTACGF